MSFNRTKGFSIRTWIFLLLLLNIALVSHGSAPQIFFLPLAVLLISSFVAIVNYYLARVENRRNSIDMIRIKTDRVKFLVQYIVLPIFGGFLLYLVTDRIYGTKEKIIIGISDFSYSDTVSFDQIYKTKYIDKANEMLGSYKSNVEFDIVSVGGGYEKLWEALDNGRVDLAIVSPFNFISDYRKDSVNFCNKYDLLGQKYTEIGHHYCSGFLAPKRLRYYNEDERVVMDDSLLADNINRGTISDDLKFIYLSSETLSTSGRIVPELWQSRYHIKAGSNLRIIKTGSTKENVRDVLNCNRSICAFSDDLWQNMKRIDPKLADNFCFIRIKGNIPMDVLVAKQGYVSGMDKTIHRLEDFIKLRNIDLSKKRSEEILGSLRYLIDTTVSDSSIIEDYRKSEIWTVAQHR